MTAKKGWSILISPGFIFICLMVAAATMLFINWQKDQNDLDQSTKIACPGLQLDQSCFSLEAAETDQARIKGLSGRANLSVNSGMLFIFDSPNQQCFWMKDMLFNLDIIWTNESKHIEKIEENLSPDTYPKSFCAGNTKYVLEFNPGFAGKHGLKIGEELKF